MQMLRKRPESDEEGFTLIELMVVVMIIAILIAIAVPTFLGARTKAQNRAAQSNLRNGFTGAKTILADGGDYTAATPAALAAAEPAMTFQAAVSTGPKIVSVAVTATTVTMAAKSDSGTCYVLKDSTAAGGGGTTYGTGSCDAASVAAVVFGASW